MGLTGNFNCQTEQVHATKLTRPSRMYLTNLGEVVLERDKTQAGKWMAIPSFKSDQEVTYSQILEHLPDPSICGILLCPGGPQVGWRGPP